MMPLTKAETAPSMTDIPQSELEAAIAALRVDHSRLAVRLSRVDHSVQTECAGLNLRLHYPALRQGRATIKELVDVISRHLIQFCLHRGHVTNTMGDYANAAPHEVMLRFAALQQEAVDLFKKAHEVTHRSGEAGELILHLLTEWVLEAPQILAKMSLKTSSEVAVHGADGVHVRFCPETGKLQVYWGEAKIHKDLSGAIRAAAESIASTLEEGKASHELNLVRRHLDLSGLSPAGRTAMIRFLDPFEPESNEREDVVTCLIAFDFAAFDEVAVDPAKADARFGELAVARLREVAPKLAAAFSERGLSNVPVEMFLLPVPSVDQLRNLFQSRIGWNS